jgi:hypothetical protein
LNLIFNRIQVVEEVDKLIPQNRFELDSTMAKYNMSQTNEEPFHSFIFVGLWLVIKSSKLFHFVVAS